MIVESVARRTAKEGKKLPGLTWLGIESFPIKLTHGTVRSAFGTAEKSYFVAFRDRTRQVEASKWAFRYRVPNATGSL